MGRIGRTFALILTLVIAMSCLTSLTVKPANAQLLTPSEEPIHFIDSGLTIYSPVNMTYNADNLVLNVTLCSAGMVAGIDPQISMNYSIDGSYFGSVPLKWDGETHVETTAVATMSLPILADGLHKLTIFLYGWNQYSNNPKYLSFTYTVYFSTTGNPPTPSPTLNPTPTSTSPISFSSGLTVYSPLNKTYTSNNVLLNVTFNWYAATQVVVNYSLDGNLIGQLPLSFGNITPGFHMLYLAYGLVDLPELSKGSHLLTFNVESRLNGNGEPYYWVNYVYFSISSSQPTTSSMSTSSTAISASSTPSVPELPWLIIVPLLLSVFSAAVIVRHRKKTAKKLLPNK